MGLRDALRSLLPGDEPPSSAETFRYRCRDCDAEFESPRRHVTDARCPDCGSADVRVADDPYLDEG